MKIHSAAILGCFLMILPSTNAGADEASAIAEVQKRGGSVRTVAQNTTDKEVTFHLTGRELTDDGLVFLQEIPDVVWLNLRGTQITDAGLQHLANLKSLKRLHLEQTAISDVGLGHLKGLDQLEYLNLYGTQVTNAAVEPLKELKSLKKLYLWQTQVTQQALEPLQAALPELEINLGADAEPGLPTQTLVTGRYVKVRLEGEKRILSLAEVQILETGTGKELQTSGQARQSSDYAEPSADRARDGNSNGVYSEGSVSHTQEETNPWWLLDLGEPKEIGKIVIHNRADCCGDRLKDAMIEVFDASLAIVWSERITEVADGSVTEFAAKP